MLETKECPFLTTLRQTILNGRKVFDPNRVCFLLMRDALGLIFALHGGKPGGSIYTDHCTRQMGCHIHHLPISKSLSYPSLRTNVLLTAHSWPQCTAVFGLAGAEQLLKFNSKKFYLNISNAGEQTNYYRSRLRTLWNIKPRKK